MNYIYVYLRNLRQKQEKTVLCYASLHESCLLLFTYANRNVFTIFLVLMYETTGVVASVSYRCTDDRRSIPDPQ